MHQQCHDFVRHALEGLTPKRVVEIGSRDVNGGVRDLLPEGCDYTGLDISDGPGVDVVADAATWKPARKPDLVLCLEVLEHTPEWQAIVTNAASWLSKRGRLVITAACDPRAPHSAVDGGPIRGGEHYGNIDADELRDALDPFGQVTVVADRDAGDVRAVLTIR
jgi:hypothetical protein